MSVKMHEAGDSQKELDEILAAMPIIEETTSGRTSALQFVDSTGAIKIISDTTDASHLPNLSRG